MEDIIEKYERSFRENADLPALTEYLSGRTYTYRELAAKVDSVHGLLSASGVAEGDKVALIGRNSIDWICAFIGTVTYGATIVPVLADFNPLDVVGIINHSDSTILFSDKTILEKLSLEQMKSVRRIFCLEDLQNPASADFDVSSIHYARRKDDDIMIISYTSGTTGGSKGVMLPYQSISINVEFAISHNFHFKGSRVLSLLPLAHAYGCAFDMLTPLAVGSHIYVLGKIPSPGILVQALGKVKPHLVCTVPLVMEKLVTKSVFPQLKKGPIKFLLKIPLLRGLAFRHIRMKMLNLFGGCIKEVNMGGAAIDAGVEDFLRKIRFPFTVGYGMTECGPLIAYQEWDRFKSGSCGQVLPSLEVMVDKEGFGNGLGEICVRGRNVMLGYYKNPQATAAALRGGWLHTGDVGMVDRSGTVFLRGRCKSMILTSAGQNIYPEEIESKLNNFQGVAESLVYEQDGKLIALVVPDAEIMKSDDREGILSYMKGLLSKLNSLVAPFEKITEIKTCSEPFEKTPKQSIKRFLYPTKAKLLDDKNKDAE